MSFMDVIQVLNNNNLLPMYMYGYCLSIVVITDEKISNQVTGNVHQRGYIVSSQNFKKRHHKYKYLNKISAKSVDIKHRWRRRWRLQDYKYQYVVDKVKYAEYANAKLDHPYVTNKVLGIFQMVINKLGGLKMVIRIAAQIILLTENMQDILIPALTSMAVMLNRRWT